MIIIHIMNRITLPRLITPTLERSLRAMPAVVMTGARQAGKSTLVRELLKSERRWFTLDDFDTLDQARRHPELLLGGDTPVTIEEVQREPQLLISIKQEIDNNRIPGQFLLTGSADLLMMQNVSESLAGRAAYLTVHPMTRREQLGLGTCGIWEELLSEDSTHWMDIVESSKTEKEDWRKLALRGGFPTPSIHMDSDQDRSVWFDGYVRTYLERDLQQLSTISNLPDFRRLMRAACLRVGQLLNQTELGRDVGLPQPTVHRYLNLLEVAHLLIRLPAYSVNRTKRLIKAPKLFWGDTGLAVHMSGITEPAGSHLENLVLQDLMSWRTSRPHQTELFFWRTVTGQEIDFVIESGGRTLPIEIKSSSKLKLSSARPIITFRDEYGKSARKGLLLYNGDDTYWLAPDVLAVPWWKVI